MYLRDEGSNLPNCQTNLDIVCEELTTDFHLGRYEPSSPPTKELHANS